MAKPNESSPVVENIPDPNVHVAPVVMSTIEIAAGLYAVGYRADTHREALKAFCVSTGLPSQGPMDSLINSLRAYGYAIKNI